MAITTAGHNNRTRFKDVSYRLSLLAGNAPNVDPAIAGAPKYSIYLEKIAVTVTTAAAQAITFRTNNGTPVILGVLQSNATAGETHVVFESEDGYPLPEGEDIDIAGTAGVAGLIEIVASLRPTPNVPRIPSQV